MTTAWLPIFISAPTAIVSNTENFPVIPSTMPLSPENEEPLPEFLRALSNSAKDFVESLIPFSKDLFSNDISTILLSILLLLISFQPPSNKHLLFYQISALLPD